MERDARSPTLSRSTLLSQDVVTKEECEWLWQIRVNEHLRYLSEMEKAWLPRNEEVAHCCQVMRTIILNTKPPVLGVSNSGV